MVSPYLCIAEKATYRALLALNTAGQMGTAAARRVRLCPRTGAGDASDESVAHWIAVLKQGERIAAQTLRCRGDYRCAAASTVVFARALIAGGALPRGVLTPRTCSPSMP